MIEKRILINSKKWIPDTTITTQEGIVFKLSSKNGVLNVEIKTPPQKVSENIPVEITSIVDQYVPRTGWLAKKWVQVKDFMIGSGVLFWILLLILAVRAIVK